MNEKPLVTLALAAYNQEQFICEAVAGVLNQTYTPLEIIISDDCSADQTFAIVQKLASEYHGPHKIILNRNPVNLGIGAHINRIMELASGELIVAAAGDDVSLPDRVEKLVETWRAAGRPKGMAFSAYEMINDSGEPMGVCSVEPPRLVAKKSDLVPYGVRGVIGASEMWHREIFDYFGPLNTDVTCEDCTLAFRAYALGEGVCYCHDVLLKRRIGDFNVSSHVVNTNDVNVLMKTFKKRAYYAWCNLKQMKRDLITLNTKNALSLCEFEELSRKFDLYGRVFDINLSLFENRISAKLKSLLQCFRWPFLPRLAVKLMLSSFVPWFWRRSVALSAKNMEIGIR